MSEENVEIVRQVFDAAARRDSASVLALYDPEVEWDNSRSGGEGLMAPGVYRGHDGLREWFREWSGPWANLDYRVGELIDGGENVIAAATMTGQGQASRVEVEWTQYAVWTIREGKIVRVVWFPERTEALEAAGLSE